MSCEFYFSLVSNEMKDQVHNKEILSLLFHPHEQILFAGDIEGCLHFNLFDLDSCCVPEGLDLNPFKPHKKGSSCRTVDVIGDASDCKIVTGGSDRTVAVSSFDPKVVSRYTLDNSVYVVKSLEENFLLAGDDEGVLTGIDIRMKAPVLTIHEQEDYITSITSTVPCKSALKSIACTAGDCTLAVYDLRATQTSESKKRKDRLVAMSDPQEDELNCSLVLNSEHNLITGDANGVVGIWKQGYWGDLKDRLPLYSKNESAGGMDGSHSIDGMKHIEDKKFILVTSDGIIRECSLFPNQVRRVIGVHRGVDGSEIATISAFDADVELGLIATSAGDSEGRIKFWSTKAEAEETSDDEDVKPKGKSKTKVLDIHKNAQKASRHQFFSDL
jgi:WD40 repeat protein